MARDKYTIELDHEEALMIVLLARSSQTGTSRVGYAVESVARALESGDPSLVDEQCGLWLNNGKPMFELEAGPQLDLEKV